MKTILTVASTLVLTMSVNAAMAGSVFDGRWPVTISGSQQFNGAHCLVIGTGAVLDNTYEGGFQAIAGILEVYLDITGSGQEPATLLFSAHAKKNGIGTTAAFEYIQGGFRYDSGTATFGTKGGC